VEYPMNKSSIVVLVSGGLDSAALVGEMAKRHRVFPVYVRQGLAWESVELYWLKKFLAALSSSSSPVVAGRGSTMPLVVLDLPMSDLYANHWSVAEKALPAGAARQGATRRRVPGARSPDKAVYLPGRNMTLSVKAAVFAAMRGIPQLAIGSLDHNPFPDASHRFYKAWSAALSQGLGKQVRIIAPYRDTSKAEVIRRNKGLPLELSFSCLAPRGKRHCGRCNKCAERRQAFKKAGITDRTRYA
jgi:7-cyano-7-deazaguanine synthase